MPQAGVELFSVPRGAYDTMPQAEVELFSVPRGAYDTVHQAGVELFSVPHGAYDTVPQAGVELFSVPHGAYDTVPQAGVELFSVPRGAYDTVPQAGGVSTTILALWAEVGERVNVPPNQLSFHRLHAPLLSSVGIKRCKVGHGCSCVARHAVRREA